MPNDDSGREGPTRRDYVKYGGTVIGGALLAGCSESGEPESTETATSTAAEPATDAETPTGTRTADDESYAVTMSPMGTVEFDRVPENVMASSVNYVDIAAALGHGAAVTSMAYPDVTVPAVEFFYSELDTSLDWSDTVDAGGFTKESLYELDSDVHFVDPCYLRTVDGWSEADVAEIEENVGPCFGNMFSRKHRQPPASCRDSYRYYTLWELTEAYAELFRERARFARLTELRDALLSDIESKLPPAEDRPTVGMVYPRLSEDSFYVHPFDRPGYFFAHVRPLKVEDAFADVEAGEYGGKLVDYEAMIEADPDVVLMNHAISGYFDVAETKQSIRDHGVGSELTAVRNDRLYASGNPRQGPVMNLFQLEMTAKQCYPERFGEWPGYDGGESYPDIPAAERLFDRQAVADVISGNV